MLRHTPSSLSAVQKCLRASISLCEPQSSRSVSTSVETTKAKPPSHWLFRREKVEEEERPSVAAQPRFKNKGTQRDGQGQDESKKRLLYPHVLSARLKKLCDDGGLDIAVEQLRNLPVDAQNTAVWNTIIREALTAKRYKLAYQLYVDMKRRGFLPNMKTFTTLLGGYCILEQWPQHTKQLEHVHTIFDNYLKYMEEIKEHDPQSPELNVMPYAAYIKILGDVGQYEKMFDIYYSMDNEGPLAPDRYIFSALFRAISWRNPNSDPPYSPEVIAETYAQNASDVKLLWRQMLKLMDKNPEFQVDSHVITSALSALSMGRPPDVLFAFDIIRDFLGLAKPGETPKPARVAMNSFIVARVLALCNVSQKWRLTVHFFRQVRELPVPPGGEAIVRRGHVEHVLRAYGGMGMMGSGQEATQALESLEWMLRETAVGERPFLRPMLSTFTLVLGACWRGGDWATAMRTFELMTGHSAEDFRDNGPRNPRIEKRSLGRNVNPDVTAVSHIVRTALTTRDLSNMRQALRIVDHFGIERLLSEGASENQEEESEADESSLHRIRFTNPEFYATKLAKDLLEVVDEVVPKTDEQVNRTVEEQRWLRIRSQARQFLRTSTHSVPIPFQEEQLLGSERGLALTDSVVEQDMIGRRMATRITR